MPLPEPDTSANLEETAALLRSNDRFLIVSHMRPDGDCLGSTLGLLLVLRALGKQVAGYNAGPLNGRWDWLPGIEHVRQDLPAWEPDWTVFVDCGGVNRVHDDFQPQGRILNIDHHLTNTRFGDVNWIDVEACAVGEQVYLLAEELGVALTQEMATALYLSIMTDTGGFRYSNTTARALELGGRMVAAGAQPALVSQNVYETKTRGEIKLTGRVLNRLEFDCGGAMVWSELRTSDYQELGASAEDEPDGLSSEIRGIEGVEVSCLFNELAEPEGGLRASFRGKGNVDCSAIATACGGGGHFNASGATLRGTDYEQARSRVLEAMRRQVEKDLGKA